MNNNNNDTSSQVSCTLLLEEAKGLPVLWSGAESVAKLRWLLSPNHPKLQELTVSEVLEKFMAQEYAQTCSVSLAVPSESSPRNPTRIRLSDNLKALWADAGKATVVKLILESNPGLEIPRQLPSKYLLILKEVNKKRVLWDGKKPGANLFYRVNDTQMTASIQTIFRKFVAWDYPKNPKLKMEALNSNDVNDKPRLITGDEILGSIFRGTSATVHLLIQTKVVKKDIAGTSASTAQNNNDDNSPSTSTGQTDVISKTVDFNLESFWMSGNWNETREAVQQLLNELETLRRERDIHPSFEQLLTEGKRAVETSLRRRNRNMDEVKKSYYSLKEKVDTIRDTYPYALDWHGSRNRVRSSSSTDQSNHPPLFPEASDSVGDLLPNPINNGHEDADNDVARTANSAVRSVAQFLRGVGIDIIDEDQRVGPLAGVAVTFAVVLGIVVVLRYMD